MCQRALTQKRTLWGGSTLERGCGAPLDPLAQLCDALHGVGAAANRIEAAELVVAQAAKWKGGMSMGADTNQTRWVVAHLSEVTALPLSPSHSLVMPKVV